MFPTTDPDTTDNSITVVQTFAIVHITEIITLSKGALFSRQTHLSTALHECCRC